MDKLGLPLENMDVQFACDIHLLYYIVGIQGANPGSMYSCPYGFCYRARRNDAGEWVRTGDPGRWIMGEARTFAKCKEKFDAWQEATVGLRTRERKRDQLKNFMSQEFVPLRIFDESHDNTPFVSLFSPQPLHGLLGSRLLIDY